MTASRRARPGRAEDKHSRPSSALDPVELAAAAHELVRLRLEAGPRSAESMVDAIERVADFHGPDAVGFLAFWLADQVTALLEVLTTYQAERHGRYVALSETYDEWTSTLARTGSRQRPQQRHRPQQRR